ncbi:MAG: hypothetical protein IJD04_01620 [Desulfovibrionaceae bacterium]|nr:hypothetical protein [Desulfovibrionaceae bacterium]
MSDIDKKDNEVEIMVAEQVGFASSKDGQYILMECTGSDGELSRVAIPTLKIPSLASVLFAEAQNAAMRLPNEEVIRAAAEALQAEGGKPLLVSGMKLTQDSSDLLVGLGFTVMRLSLCDEARQEIKRCVKALRRKQAAQNDDE